ncbi:hypothetical protein ABPG72_004775 [Tetrahymena utriculariae]
MEENNQVVKIVANTIKEVPDLLYSQYKGQKDFDIKITDIGQHNCFSELKLDGPFKNCQKLKLLIKSQLYCFQNDFDMFCSQVKELKSLKTLKLRYYNKFIRNINALLACIKDLEEVELLLQDFNKIELQENIIYQDYQIKRLTLNLFNTSFKQGNQGLINFINSLNNLYYLKLSIDSFTNLQILQNIKNKEIQIDLHIRKVDFKFCDLLKNIVQTEKLEVQNIYFTQILIGCYLQYIGFKQVSHTNDSGHKNRVFQGSDHIALKQLSKSDIHLLKQSGFLVEQVKALYKDFQRISFFIDTCYFNSIFQSIIAKVDNSSFNIHIYQYNYLNYQKQTFNKKQNIWQVFFIKNDEQKLRQLSCTKNYLTTLEIQLSQQSNADKLFLIQLSNILIQFKYLTFFDFFYANLNNQLIKSIRNIIRCKSQDKLRFIVYQKTIFGLIPLPKQVFYDLIEE